MYTTDQNEQQILLQSTEAAPLEDRSLPADEVLNEQQSDLAEGREVMPIFVP